MRSRMGGLPAMRRRFRFTPEGAAVDFQLQSIGAPAIDVSGNQRQSKGNPKTIQRQSKGRESMAV
jgi:hypothetical protein